jgi:hypothetical protein
MRPDSTRALLVGRSERAAKRWGLGAVALLLGSAGFFAAVKAAGYPSFHLLLWWEGYAVLLVALVAVQAYSSGGLAPSWALAFGAVAGVILNYGGIGLTGPGPGPVELLALAVAGSGVAAAVFGTLGFLVGTAVRETVA